MQRAGLPSFQTHIPQSLYPGLCSLIRLSYPAHTGLAILKATWPISWTRRSLFATWHCAGTSTTAKCVELIFWNEHARTCCVSLHLCCVSLRLCCVSLHLLRHPGPVVSRWTCVLTARLLHTTRRLLWTCLLKRRTRLNGAPRQHQSPCAIPVSAACSHVTGVATKGP